MSRAPASVIDTLNSLLEAEQGSLIRYLAPASPYLTQATAKLRGQIEEWVVANRKRAGELAFTISSLGGEPAPRPVRPEEQYLAYLSLRFLLPKLVDSKQLLLDRYENALTLLKEEGTPGGALELVTRFRDEHARQLAEVRGVMEEVLDSKM